MKPRFFGIASAAMLTFQLARAQVDLQSLAEHADDQSTPCRSTSVDQISRFDPRSVRPDSPAIRAPQANLVSITVDPNDWGGGDPLAIGVVLHEVAAELLSRSSRCQALAPIRVSRSIGWPVTLFDRGPVGEYRIELSASGGAPGPYIYEFAHEFCHVMSNFERHRHAGAKRSQQWFEEAVCEVASLYALKALASRWRRDAPSQELAAAAPGLMEIARRFQQERHRRLLPGTTLASWYRAVGSQLDSNAYDRDRNEIVANLMLPLFEENPDLWGAIAFLNLDMHGTTFQQYLQSWLDKASPRYKDVIRYTMTLFFQRETPVVVAGGAFPLRPLEIIVTFGPGGGADGMARKLAELLAPLLGMPVLVENVAGAAGNAGLTKLLLSSDPDHTMATLIALTAAAWADGVGTLGPADFTVLGVVQQSPSMLFVARDSPLYSFSQFLALAKKQPSSLRVATSGRGTLDDLSLALLGSAGYPVLNSPFANPLERYRAALERRVDALFEEPGDVAEFLADGSLRPLVTFSDVRHPSFPEVQAVHEFDLPIGNLPNFRTLAVNASVGKDKVAVLVNALDKALGSVEWQAYCVRTFTCTITNTPAEAMAQVQALVDRVIGYRARLPR